MLAETLEDQRINALCLGPALGELGPASNFAGLGDFQTWVYSFAMLLGRLEMFTILVLFTPAFWRK